MYRAVVFDLWMTLVTPPEEAFAEFRRRWSRKLRVPSTRLDEFWFGEDAYRQRETGPIRDVIVELCRQLGVEADVDEVLAWRLELMRSALVPDDGVVETLAELRGRGILTGLISNCTEDVALVWEETPFAGLFDVAVFSAAAGCMKPDRRIYELALAELPVEAPETIFVGDGANDELEGARRAGLMPVLFQRNGERPRWDGLERWSGRRVTEIPQVLELIA